MSTDRTHALSEVLNHLEAAADGDHIKVKELIERLGHNSFASIMLVFSLICTSPASAIPGVTTLVAVIVFMLTLQMIVGRDVLWLPVIVTDHELSSVKLRQGINWLRKPVGFVERFLKVRLTFVFHRPLFWVPLFLILFLTLFMPFMEVVPASGSIASALIAIFAAGLLTRDGALVLLSVGALLIVPFAIWQLGFGG